MDVSGKQAICQQEGSASAGPTSDLRSRAGVWVRQRGNRVVVPREVGARATMRRTLTAADQGWWWAVADGACSGVADELGPARVAIAVSREFSLTAREAEVLAAATLGKGRKEIACELGISGKTVDYFWAAIFRKLRCSSHTEVMALLLKHACARRSDAGLADQHPE